jgi:hypothetical protein
MKAVTLLLTSLRETWSTQADTGLSSTAPQQESRPAAKSPATMERGSSAAPAPASTASRTIASDERRRIGSGSSWRPIRYVGDDLDEMERKMKTFAPGWLAYDMRLMLRRYQLDGAMATPAALERLTTHLGRPPHSYRDFAAETAKQWAAAPQATPVATAARTA